MAPKISLIKLDPFPEVFWRRNVLNNCYQ